MLYYKRPLANKDDAKANLINAERMASKYEHVNALGQAAAKIENKLSKTHEALKTLGAGKPYGA